MGLEMLTRCLSFKVLQGPTLSAWPDALHWKGHFTGFKKHSNKKYVIYLCSNICLFWYLNFYIDEQEVYVCLHVFHIQPVFVDYLIKL